MTKRVTLGGSYRKHLDRILACREQFIALGWEVVRPSDSTVAESDSPDFVRLEGDPSDAAGIQRTQLAAIESSDLYYVVNPGGYVGPSATAEVAWAKAKGIPVILSEQAFEQAVRLLAEGHGSPDSAATHIREDA